MALISSDGVFALDYMDRVSDQFHGTTVTEKQSTCDRSVHISSTPLTVCDFEKCILLVYNVSVLCLLEAIKTLLKLIFITIFALKDPIST